MQCILALAIAAAFDCEIAILFLPFKSVISSNFVLLTVGWYFAGNKDKNFHLAPSTQLNSQPVQYSVFEFNKESRFIIVFPWLVCLLLSTNIDKIL